MPPPRRRKSLRHNDLRQLKKTSKTLPKMAAFCGDPIDFWPIYNIIRERKQHGGKNGLVG